MPLLSATYGVTRVILYCVFAATYVLDVVVGFGMQLQLANCGCWVSCIVVIKRTALVEDRWAMPSSLPEAALPTRLDIELGLLLTAK
jgi:hypothetical protein